MSWWPERLGVEAADSCRADRAPAGVQADAATPLAGEAVDAFTGRLVRDYRVALDNLTAVQTQCTEQALEIRVLRRALDYACKRTAFESDITAEQYHECFIGQAKWDMSR